MPSGPADVQLGKEEFVFFCMGSLPKISAQCEDTKPDLQTSEGQLSSTSRRKQESRKTGRRTSSESRGAMNRNGHDGSPLHSFTVTSPGREHVQASTTLLTTFEAAPSLPSLPSILSVDRAAAAKQFNQTSLQVQAKRRHGQKRRGRNPNPGKPRPDASSIEAAADSDSLQHVSPLPMLQGRRQEYNEESPPCSRNFNDHLAEKHLPDIHTPPGRRQPAAPHEQLTPVPKVTHPEFPAPHASRKAHASQQKRLPRLAEPLTEEAPLEANWAPLEQLKQMKEVGLSSRSGSRRPVHHDSSLLAVGKPNWRFSASHQRGTTKQMLAPMAQVSMLSKPMTQKSVLHETIAQEAEKTLAPEALAPGSGAPAVKAPLAQASFAEEPPPQALGSSTPAVQSTATPEPDSETSSLQKPMTKVRVADPERIDATPATADAAIDANADESPAYSSHGSCAESSAQEAEEDEKETKEWAERELAEAKSSVPQEAEEDEKGTQQPAWRELGEATLAKEDRFGPGEIVDPESAAGSEYSDEFEFGSEADATLEEAESKDDASTPKNDADSVPQQKRLDRTSLRVSYYPPFETTDESQERIVFNKLAKNFEILREQLPEALGMLDYRDVNVEWVEEFATQEIDRRSLLNFQEFSQIVTLYCNKHVEVLSEEFRAMDLDGNGNISAGELSVHLEKNGITVVPGIVRDLLKEISGDQDAEQCGIDAYVHLREIIQYRGGFTIRETEAMDALFKRYDADGSGTMDLSELTSAIKWLGFALCADEDFRSWEGCGSLDMNQRKSFTVGKDTLNLSVEDLVEGFDVSNGGLSSQDFLQVMRRRRECEIRHLSQLFHDNNYSGCLSMEGVVTVYRALGYQMASPEVVEEISRECHVLHMVQEGFYFDDVYVILQTFKRKEGFLNEDIRKFRELFDIVDVDKSGNVDVVELGSIFRHLGIRVGEEELLQIFDATDIDGSGEIDFDELLKAMRWFTEDEYRTLERAFEEGDLDGNGLLDAAEIKCLLPAIGYPKLNPMQAEIVSRETEKDLNFSECMQMMKLMRDQAREDFLTGRGFSEKEQEELQELFNVYDKRGTGYIANENLVKLLTDSFPQETHSKAGQALIAEHLQTVDEDGDGKLAFKEFLTLVRMLRDREMHEEAQREMEKAKAAGFTVEEMRNYRKVFMMCDSDASKDVDVDELLRMFVTMVPMTVSMTGKIRAILEQVDEDGSASLDFSEFLTAMRMADDALKEHLASRRASVDAEDQIGPQILADSPREGEPEPAM